MEFVLTPIRHINRRLGLISNSIHPFRTADVDFQSRQKTLHPAKSKHLFRLSFLGNFCIIAVIVFSFGSIAAVSSSHANGDEHYSEQPAVQVSKHEGKISQATVVVNKASVIKLNEPYTETLVGNDKIADVLPLTNKSLYILGKSVGSTSLVVLDSAKRVQRIIEVEVTHDLVGLKKRLGENLSKSNIRISSVNGKILLSGTVQDSVALDKAMAIANQYAPESVTNALSVHTTQQVMLEVRFIEASRSASRELGVSFRVRGQEINANIGPQAVVGAGGFIQTAAMLSGAQPFGTLIANLLSNGTNADAIIRALEKRGLARRLAEPNLISLSGDTASFLAGGEFPFPVSADDNKLSIEFKQFGIALAFTPTVLQNGLINLKIVPEVSELDPTNSVEVNGIRVPGLVVRRANTTVELRNGQSFAIAGLLQHTHTKNQDQLPWIGQVPVLGALFRSAEYQKNETDLVIIVTPRLVKPKVPGERLQTPLDNHLSSNDKDFFLLGKSEIAKNSWGRVSVRRAENQFGHIIQIDEQTAYRSYK